MLEGAILTRRCPGLRPAHPSQRYGLGLRRFFIVKLLHGQEIQGRAGGSKPVAEIYTAARAVEWLIRFYDALPDQAKFPDMTALWHEQQKAIQAGQRDTESFVRELMDYIAGEVAGVKENGLAIKVDTHPCPLCAKPLRRIKKKEKNEFFWGCTGFADGCKFACEDKAGKPVPRETPKVSELHKCMACGSGLSRRASTKKKGMFWWGCSNYPTCTQTYPDIKGKPDYSKPKE